ncbi:hypothetical protein [Streptomyces gardneri]|uniref:hypothetical protein n=1 Tax=Streptomyces gardneri TaxID=66892 RepID=UPI0035D7261C
MASIHKFYDRRVSLVVGTGALVVHRVSEDRLVIPLAVIAEVHRPEPRSLDLLLTDGEVQHVDCIDSDAMAEFAATLTRALPEQRDPAGSARIIGPGARGSRWDPDFTAVVLCLLAYVGYTVWVGFAYEWRVLGPIAGALPLLLGGVLCVVTGSEVHDRRKLARRGVVVEAEDIGRRIPMYYFNDADGVPHLFDSRSNTPTIRIICDPRRPYSGFEEMPRAALIRKVTLRLTAGGLLLWLGGWLAFGLLG